MKRFWVFVIICVVALGIGFTVFRFMTREEILYINQTVFEVNRGETKKIEVVKENLKAGHSPKAEISNTSIVEWTDEENFVFKAKNGGTTTITFTSDLTSFNPVTVQVTVGDGNSSTPFFIKNKDDLASIGQSKVDENEGLTYIYPLTANYKLVADISDLANENWKPIAEGDDAGFTGTFDFNGHAISNLAITSATGDYAGLFSKIGIGGRVIGANMLNTRVSADVAYAGAVAGANFGTIESARITNVNISNSAQNAVIGGVVGLNSGMITKTTVSNRITDFYLRATGANSCAGGIAGISQRPSLNSNVYIGRCSSKTSVSAEGAVGGIVGKNIAAAVENCYAGTLTDDYMINSGATTFAGGIVGLNEYRDFGETKARAYVADTYSAMKFGATNSANSGAIIGKNNNDSASYNIVYGNYYSTETNQGLEGIGVDINGVDSEVAKTYNRTLDQLKKQTTYFSFIDTEHGSVDKYWQFAEGAWTINEDVSLPELSFEVNYIVPRYLDFVNPEAINNAKEFMEKLNPEDPSKFNSSLPYRLENDIYLNSALTEGAFVPFEFNGLLDGNGHTIYLTITTPNGVVNGATGLFTKLGAGAKLKNIKVVATINSILTADHIGAIAAYNNGGSLTNCSASGTITTDRATGTMYIAGLVAENKGYINGGVSSVAVTYEKSPTLVYIGGVAGYSTGSIENCKNNGVITAKNKTEAYVGGIVGWTSGTVVKCANHGEISGEVEASTAYYGGIAGMLAQNAEAKMSYCSSYEPITGSNAGGLVGISIGAIEFCYSSARVTGVHIGGLAYNIKQGTTENRSYIKNSMTDNSILYGENDNAVVCGVVYQIDVSSAHLCYCEKIFTSCKFQGAGDKYYESQSNIRGINRDWNPLSAVDMDAFNNCLYVKRDNNIIRSNGDFSWNWSDWGQAKWNRTGHPDSPITEDQAKGSDGYKAFSDNNYSNKYWAFEEGSYPRVLGIAD